MSVPTFIEGCPVKTTRCKAVRPYECLSAVQTANEDSRLVLGWQLIMPYHTIIIMDSEEPNVSLPSSATSKMRRILKPVNGIHFCCNFLKSKRWTTCMQSLWTDHQKTREIPCKLPIHNLDVTFLDGTPMKIEYVFDPTRQNRDYVFVKLDCLLPVLGGAMPSTTDGLASISELCCFVRKEVHLDECQNFQHASCLCGLIREDQDVPDPVFVVKPSVDACEHQHFHHFCWKHVVSWLYNYLNLWILVQESKQHFDEEIPHLYSMFPDHIVHFQTGERITPEFLFKTALKIETATYESDDQ
ncbi:repeat element 7 [Diadegma semiclausum ichnovirus]|nr:repeat element 7 [Diadegma semiclausum ichnovirus]